MEDFTVAKRGNELFLIKDGSLEYTAKVKGNGKKITLKRSDSDTWCDHVKGERVAKLKDTGNGIIIEFEDWMEINFDYDEFCEFYTLMKLKVEADPNL